MNRNYYKRLAVLAIFAGMVVGMTSNLATAQTVDLSNRPVAEVRVEGLEKAPEQLVRNQIRIAKGDPYDAKVVQNDIVRLTHLGRFKTVEAKVEQLDTGSVIITYVVSEQAVITEVRTVGNKAINDYDLLAAVVMRPGDPIDPFIIDRGVQGIKRLYENKGFFLTDVQVDQELLNESGVLLFRVREGPKVRVRDITVEGNEVFSDKELQAQIKSKTYIFILRGGELSREKLDEDVDRVRNYYRDRGYLDAQVGRRIDLSPNQKDAVVVIFVDEGKQYTVDSIRIEGNELFPTDQILENMSLKVGDVFSQDRLRNSQTSLTDLYGKIGFIATNIQIERLFHEDAPLVDVVVRIKEGSAYTVGKLAVRGNRITKDRVIIRQVRGMNPGETFDRTGIEVTERRLRESTWFSDAKVTILGEEEDPTRDVLIEVKEKNTGSLSFGAGVSSDAGVIGAIELTQRNFDIADVPESPGEFFTGRAFRGAGQYFSLALQPGDETSRYSVNFRDPYIFDTQYFFDMSIFYFDRERDDYDERRYGGVAGLGQRFGDVWSAKIGTRFELVDISNLQPTAPADLTSVAGESTITSVDFTVSRATVDSGLFPTRGSRASFTVSRAGAIGGDYDFTALSFRYRKYWTVDEDFLGRRTVVSLRNEIGYILEDNEAPIFERFYAGGHRSFRGFDYRGIGPRGVNLNGTLTRQSTGGEWLFLLGVEYNMPIYQEIVRMVIFTDTGTVANDAGFEDYRVSVGAGLRLQIPFLGQAPFAFDFAYPVVKEPNDDERIFSFDIALPF